MLTEIYCKAFADNKWIPFSKGLNIIQGIGNDSDEDSSNSIGKTSMLKIIDYAFGGNYYARSNKDIIRHIGEHDICFTHEFDGTAYHFYRNASKSNTIIQCSDDNYTPKNKITEKEFCKWLVEQYKLEELDLSFRQIVGLYSRIWNKSNKEVNRPLYHHNAELVKDSIESLIKLFDKYKPIQSLHKQEIDLEKRQKVRKQAANHKLINIPTKPEQSKLMEKLSSINNKIFILKANIGIGCNENCEQINNYAYKLYEQRAILSTQHNRIERALRRCKKNIEKLSPINEAIFAPLVKFFPNVNLKHIQEVQNFHNSLRNILQNELINEKTKLEEQLYQIIPLIESNDQEIQEITDLPTHTAEALEQLEILIKQQTQIQAQLELYHDKISDSEKSKENKDILIKLMSEITEDIQKNINNRISKYSNQIATSNSKAPIFHLTPNTYSYGVEDNTGTGKAYTDLLLFDIAILSLTDLPILIHDSFLFNNIDDFTKQSFLRLYNNFSNKQIFIALDQFYGNDDDEIDQILKNSTALFLSSNRLLFGKDWRTEET